MEPVNQKIEGSKEIESKENKNAFVSENKNNRNKENIKYLSLIHI